MSDAQMSNSEERYRQLFQNSAIGMYRSKLDGSNILEINNAFANMYGYTIEELIGRPSSILWAEPKKREEMVRQLQVTGKLTNYEAEMVGKNGSRLTILLSARIYPEQGIIEGATLDITERKQVEKDLKISEERLKILFEEAPDAYYLSDLKGFFIDGNKAAEKLIGYPKQELLGKSFLKLKLLPLQEIPKAAAALAKNVLGSPTGPDEFTLIRKDGLRRQIEIKTYPVKLNNQTLVLGIARDVTERRQVEEEREKFNRFLTDREDRLIELKREVNELLTKLGRESKYAL